MQQRAHSRCAWHSGEDPSYHWCFHPSTLKWHNISHQHYWTVPTHLLTPSTVPSAPCPPKHHGISSAPLLAHLCHSLQPILECTTLTPSDFNNSQSALHPNQVGFAPSLTQSSSPFHLTYGYLYCLPTGMFCLWQFTFQEILEPIFFSARLTQNVSKMLHKFVSSNIQRFYGISCCCLNHTVHTLSYLF